MASKKNRHEVGPPNEILEYAEIAGFYNPDNLDGMTDGEQAEYRALLEGGGDESWAADFFGFDLAGYELWKKTGVLPSDLRKTPPKKRNRKSTGQNTGEEKERLSLYIAATLAPIAAIQAALGSKIEFQSQHCTATFGGT